MGMEAREFVQIKFMLRLSFTPNG